MENDSLSAVVFDAVGTLIYPDPNVATVYTSAGRRFGSRLTESEVAGRFRAVFAAVELRDRAGELRTSEEFETARWREIVRRVLDDVTDYAGCFAELFAHFARPRSWRVFPDVAAVFASFGAAGVTRAIASNFDQRLFDIARQLEPLNACRHVLVSSQIGFRKPHRQFFEAVVSAVGGEPDQVLYVGDDPHCDVAGARAAGLRAVLLDRRGDQGTGSINSLDQLPQAAAIA